MTTLLWFRRDLRVADNPAFAAALARGKPIIPVYIRDDPDAGDRAPGRASNWWLNGSLGHLGSSLQEKASALILRSGPAARVIDELVQETAADSVLWNRRYEPWAMARDTKLKSDLRARGIAVESFNANLLKEPWDLRTANDAPYRVFTPFWKKLRQPAFAPEAAQLPARIPGPARYPASENLKDWALTPTTPDWAGGLRATWMPGEAGALSRLSAFVDRLLPDYPKARDTPGVEATSRLSPHLHFGEIGPRQVWRAVQHRLASAADAATAQGAEKFLSGIAWREFSYHLLFQFPELPHRPFRAQFARFPWENPGQNFRAWKRGETGFPIVDAGLRELWNTGWMHNRVRMIVASFLIKDLLIDWRLGERVFWDRLVDADLASNAASWQWVAGSGADAAPFFRIFNPVLQGRSFDPHGTYVRRWIPELARLPDHLIHEPWRAREIELKDANVGLGRSYPRPIVDHAAARARALAALRGIKST